MFFENINNISDSSLFKELSGVYARIVEAIARKNAVEISEEINSKAFSELHRLGIVDSYEDFNRLTDLLGEKDTTRLLRCASFVYDHKSLIADSLNCLDNQFRARSQEESLKSNKPTVADFFCGAGGLSLGFTQAGYRVAFANDFTKECIDTYRYNHPDLPEQRVLCADVKSIVDNLESYIQEPIDIVVGGPPCQGFSSANKQRIIDDPRNELYKYFIKAISVLLPKFVVMENVKGMLSVANQVVEDYGNISVKKGDTVYSYDVKYRILNSVDFSVAQSRERLIYIAVRNDIEQDLGLNPDKIFDEIAQSNRGKKTYTLADALEGIRPLKAPRIKNMNEVDSDEYGRKVDINDCSKKSHPYIAFINDGRDIPLIFNHKARFVNDINYQIYARLNQGDDATDPKIADIMPYANRNHCFKDKYYKLIANKPSRTITAHLRMDCHSHIHPFQTRALTPREAARCQSFPDDYFFLGAYLKTYMQIGNAVPVKMAKQIAECIKKYL